MMGGEGGGVTSNASIASAAFGAFVAATRMANVWCLAALNSRSRRVIVIGVNAESVGNGVR